MILNETQTISSMRTMETEFLSSLEKHKGILHKVARMYMDGEADCEDLRQEIIIQLWKSYQTYKGESAFSTWMYRVPINTAITFFKKKKKLVTTFSPEVFPEQEVEEYDSSKDKQMELFYKAVHQLKPIEKAIIFYLLEGLSYREIGKNLGISEGNARVKLNRTKEKLQMLLKNKDYEF